MPDPAPLRVQRTTPYAKTESTGDSVCVTIGITLVADIAGMVPDEHCDAVWGRFFTGLDELDARLEACLRDHLGDVETGLDETRQEAEATLAARFETCSNAQPCPRARD